MLRTKEEEYFPWMSSSERLKKSVSEEGCPKAEPILQIAAIMPIFLVSHGCAGVDWQYAPHAMAYDAFNPRAEAVFPSCDDL